MRPVQRGDDTVLTILEEADFIVIRAVGTLGKEGYEQFVPEFERTAKARGQVAMLIDATEFEDGMSRQDGRSSSLMPPIWTNSVQWPSWLRIAGRNAERLCQRRSSRPRCALSIPTTPTRHAAGSFGGARLAEVVRGGCHAYLLPLEFASRSISSGVRPGATILPSTGISRTVLASTATLSSK